MFNSIKKDRNQRIRVKKFEIKRLQSKAFLQDLSLIKKLTDFSLKQSLTDKINSNKQTDLLFFLNKKIQKSVLRNSSKNRVQNRCIESGRSGATLKFCKLSRINLRERASRGNIPGLIKASW